MSFAPATRVLCGLIACCVVSTSRLSAASEELGPSPGTTHGLEAPEAADPAPAPTTGQEAEESSEAEAASAPWKIGGEVDVSYVANLDSESSSNFGRVFDSQADQFTLHQAEVWVERAASEETPFGFTIDLVAGDDAEKIHAAGLGDGSDSFDLTQAYVSYQVPGVDGLQLKAGKFVTLHGSELIRPSGNFNFSRSILFGFAIPFTHTGLLATYAASEKVALTGGIVNGWDNADDNNSDKSLHAMAAFAPTSALSLTIGGTYGAEQADNSSSKRSLIDVIATFALTEDLKLSFNYDWAEEEDAVFDSQSGGLGTASWDGLAAYLTYAASDKLAFGARVEYFNDNDGVRFGYTDPLSGNAAQLELWEATLTARFTLREGLVAILEYRHDESDGQLVFNDGLDDAQDTLSVAFSGTF